MGCVACLAARSKARGGGMSAKGAAAAERHRAMMRRTYCQSCCILALILAGLIALAVGATRRARNTDAEVVGDHFGTTSTTPQGPPFDCEDGYDHRASWSLAKMYWCCEHDQKGCDVLKSDSS